MEIKTAMTYSDKALRACFVLHDELTTSDAAWGYNATKEDFDRLYAEILVICRDELPDTAEIDEVCEMFWDYQLEQMNGDREVGWFEYTQYYEIAPLPDGVTEEQAAEDYQAALRHLESLGA